MFRSSTCKVKQKQKKKKQKQIKQKSNLIRNVAQKHLEEEGVKENVELISGDFFNSNLIPESDIFFLSLILHDWNLEKKLSLLKNAYTRLRNGGILVVMENFIDPERRKNTFPMMMSLNMLVDYGDAFDFTETELLEWCRSVGFEPATHIPDISMFGTAVSPSELLSKNNPISFSLSGDMRCFMIQKQQK